MEVAFWQWSLAPAVQRGLHLPCLGPEQRGAPSRERGLGSLSVSLSSFRGLALLFVLLVWEPSDLRGSSETTFSYRYELKHASHISKLPKGKHSVKGLGKTTPDPSASITMDGVEVPLGTGISSGVNDTCLLYNEYIVYDIAQVHLKYLLKLKFNFKTSLWWAVRCAGWWLTCFALTDQAETSAELLRRSSFTQSP